MNQLIETLNQLGDRFSELAWPMLWQSSLLIAALFAFDFLLRQRIRASVRYALWLVVLIKLVLPPTLALPTSPAWWLHRNPVAVQTSPLFKNFTVTYDATPLPVVPLNSLSAYVPPVPVLTLAAWLLLTSIVISAGLLVWLLVRWWRISQLVRRAETSERLTMLVIGAERQLRPTNDKIKSSVSVKVPANMMSPAVCGLFRPVILIPQTLAENFSDEQLRAVLLHELIHLRRGDVWVNFWQSLLQIVYWWHPLVWLAHARIRRVREEAVDDAVMLALAGDAETYAPTLLKVAKLALNRPLASLGLVGILESRSALRQRIERLVDFRPPRRAGLTLVSLVGILTFTAVAVPMGNAPAPVENQATSVPQPVAGVADAAGQNINPQRVLFQASLYQMSEVDFQQAVAGLKLDPLDQKDNSWWAASPEQFSQLTNNLKSVGLKAIKGAGFITDGSGPATFCIGNGTNGLALFCAGQGTDGVELDCLPRVTNGLIDLAIQNRGIGTFANVMAPNPFSGNTILENHGGLVFRINGSADSSKVVILGIKFFSEPGGVSFSGISTNPNFQTALAALQQRTGVETLPEPEVVRTVGHEINRMDPETLASIQEKMTSDVTDSRPNLSLSDATPGRITVSFGIYGPYDEVSLKKQFLAAGVNMPPTTLLFGNNGTLLASGSKEQLALVERVVLKLNGVPAENVDGVVRQFLKDHTGIAKTDSAGTNLLMRVFKLGTTFPFELEKITGMPVDNAAHISAAARALFIETGVNLKSPPGKSVFYNDRLEVLFVRAPESDLDVIERAVQTLNQSPPQVHIKSRFIEVPKTVWNNYKQSLGINYLTNQSAGVTGIMTGQDFRKALATLQMWDGVETLARPEVVTISGRQTQMRVTQVITVITNFAFQEIVTNLATDFIPAKFVTNSTITPQTAQVEIGPTLDTVPYVLSDDYTVNLTAIASLTDFLGYNNSTNTNAAFTSSAEKVDLPTIAPVFQTRQSRAIANLWGGQTLVMEISIPKQVEEMSAAHSDVPTVGHLSRSQSKTEPEKTLLVFMTVDIVDPAGNRVHTDADLPFAKDAIPVQPKL